MTAANDYLAMHCPISLTFCNVGELRYNLSGTKAVEIYRFSVVFFFQVAKTIDTIISTFWSVCGGQYRTLLKCFPHRFSTEVLILCPVAVAVIVAKSPRESAKSFSRTLLKLNIRLVAFIYVYRKI